MEELKNTADGGKENIHQLADRILHDEEGLEEVVLRLHDLLLSMSPEEIHKLGANLEKRIAEKIEGITAGLEELCDEIETKRKEV